MALYTCIFPHLLMSVAELDGKGGSSNTSGSLGLLLLTVVVVLKWIMSITNGKHLHCFY